MTAEEKWISVQRDDTQMEMRSLSAREYYYCYYYDDDAGQRTLCKHKQSLACKETELASFWSPSQQELVDTNIYHPPLFSPLSIEKES